MRSLELSTSLDPREVYSISADDLSDPARRADLERVVTLFLTAPEDVFEEWAIVLLQLTVAEGTADSMVRMIRADAADTIARDGLNVIGDQELVELARNQFALRDVRDAIERLKDLYDDWHGQSPAAPVEDSKTEITQPTREIKPSPSSNKMMAIRLSKFVPLAIAAMMLLFLGITFAYAQRQAAVNARREADTLAAKLIQMEKARPLPLTPEEAYQMGLGNAVRVDVMPAPLPDKPGLVHLLLSNFAQPPYIVKVSLDWNDPPPGSRRKSVFEDVYVAGQKPLARVHDYTPRLPVSGEDQITVTILFEVTGETMRQMGTGPIIKQIIQLRLTHDGVRVSSPGEADATTVALTMPAEGAALDDPFLLQFKITRPLRITDHPAKRLHVLVHALDGQLAIRDQYFVLPFQDDDIGATGGGVREGSVWVQLRPLMDLDSVRPRSERPTRFEVLFVDLPFVLTEWSIPTSELDLAGPDMVGAVKCRRVVTVNATVAGE